MVKKIYENWPLTARDFSEDYPGENGFYQCIYCNEFFFGHKYCHICKECEISLADIFSKESSVKETRMDYLYEAIKALNERDRVILTLFYLEHLSYKEIAECLECEISNVFNNLIRILGLLKNSLKE